MAKTTLPEITSMSDQAIDWIILLHSGRATEQDKTDAEQWRRRSAEHARAYVEAEALWRDMGQVMAAGQTDRLQSTPHRSAPGKRRRTPVRGWALGFAAAAMLLLLVTPFSRYRDLWRSDYHTAIGGQQTLTLADGSEVRLNTDSAIAVHYGQNKREIRLYRGQAMFSVQADARRPFAVVTDEARITALGTVFEVWDDGGDTRVTVVEHAVSLTPVDKQSGGQALVIAEGQQAGYGEESGWQSPEPVDLSEATAWERGKLIFRNQALGEVIAELERYLPGRIVITDDALRSLKVSGVFPIRDAGQVPDMIGKTLPVKVVHLSPWLTVLYPS